MTSLASYLFTALPTWHCRTWWKPPGLLLSFYCKQYKLEVKTLPFHKLSWNCLLCLLTTVVFESMMWETYKQWKFIMNSYVACCCWKGSCRVCFPCLLWLLFKSCFRIHLICQSSFKQLSQTSLSLSRVSDVGSRHPSTGQQTKSLFVSSVCPSFSNLAISSC